MSTTCNRTRLGHAILLALLASAQASAQEVAKPDAADSSTLGTIMVTAEKRSEDIQQVPMSIGVIDVSTLENLHATQLSDYAAYIPGFTVIDGGAPGQATLGVRGITPLSAGSTVATYIDETPLGTSSNYGGGSNSVVDLLPYDFQSVEILRGPQGTLYGASALGGVLRYVTRQPDLNTWSWRFGADAFTTEGASDAGYDGRFGFNAPIVPGQLALSGSVARQDSPGYIDNVRTGKKDQNAFTQQAGHLQMLWKATDDLSITLQAIQSKNDADSSSFVALDPVSLKPTYGDLTDDNYIPEPFKKDTNYYNATINWHLAFADFVSSTSYSEITQHNTLDASDVYGVVFPLFGLPDVGISAVNYDLKLYKTTQEFRLTSNSDGQVEWLIGAFYTDENSKQNQAASAQFLDYSSIPGLDPLAVVGLPSTYKEYAFFGDVTYKIDSTFDITGGLRYAHNDQTFHENTSGALTGTVNIEGQSNEDVVTWSFSPRMHLSADQMLYLRIATGYQPGGPNIALPGVPLSVDASTLTNYEIGWKALFDDNRLMIDAALFDVEWDKIQVTAQANGVGYLANGGTARSSGMEFAMLYAPVAGLRLGFNGAYTDAKLTEAVPSLGGFDGSRLPAVPKWAMSATADWSFPAWADWTGRVGGGVRYVGDTLSSVEGNPLTLPQDSYTAIDLNADVSNDRWTVRLYIRNLADKRVYTSLAPLSNPVTGEIIKVNGVPLTPRTIGIGFDAKF
ncbi:MAG TPA: TonB-dependent receptor [Rudaea sp.]|jgi:outer membrane receptor protein involved in Fe transport